LLAPQGDQGHGLVPRRLLEPAALADERPRQPIRTVIGLPAVQPLGPEPAAVDPVDPPAADPDDPPVLDPDVQGAADRAEDAARLDPRVGPLGDVLVDADRPPAASPVRGAAAPRVLDAVAGFGHGRHREGRATVPD